MASQLELEAKLHRQAAELTRLNQVLVMKNAELDGHNHVWCNGGCQGGVAYPKLITEEVVVASELHSKRLRTWWTNKQYHDTQWCVNCGRQGHTMCSRSLDWDVSNAK